jgi:hypothetical protein
VSLVDGNAGVKHFFRLKMQGMELNEDDTAAHSGFKQIMPSTTKRGAKITNRQGVSLLINDSLFEMCPSSNVQEAWQP